MNTTSQPIAFSSKANAKRAIKTLGEYAADMADEFISKDETSGVWLADIAAAKACQASCAEADAAEQQPNEEQSTVAQEQSIDQNQPLDTTQYDAEAEAKAREEASNQPAPYKDPTIPSRPKNIHAEIREAINKESSSKTLINLQQRVSTVLNPCLFVWNTADAMFAQNPHTRRKDVIAECVKSGIAFYTARTQYQQWLTVNKDKISQAKATHNQTSQA